MRGGAGEKRGGAAFVDTAFDEVAGGALVLEPLGEAGEVLDALRADHGVAADQAGDTVFGETREPRVQETDGGGRRGIRHGRQRRTPCERGNEDRCCSGAVTFVAMPCEMLLQRPRSA